MKKAIFILLLIISSSIRGQQTHFTSLTANEGLSSNTVYCSFKDHLGFLWIGTEDGLNRYDGNQFVIYRHNFSDSASIASSIVFSITEDSSGNIWLATATGVSCWNRSHNSFKNYFFKKENQIISVPMANIALGAGGKIYSYSFTVGSVYFLDKKSNVLSIDDFIERKKISEHGRIFWCSPAQAGVVTDSSLWLYNFQRSTFVEWIAPENSGSFVPLQSNVVLAVQNDSIWMSLWEEHNLLLFSRSNGTWSTNAFANLPVGTHFSHLLPFDQHHWWITAYAKGIIEYDPQSGHVHLYENDSPQNSSWRGAVTFDCSVDRDRAIWFSTNKGLSFMAQSDFHDQFIEEEAAKPQPVHLSAINCLALDAHHNLWAGLLNYGDQQNGVVLYNIHDNTLTSFQNDFIHDRYNGNLIWNILSLDSFIVISEQLGTVQFDLRKKKFESLSDSFAPQEIISSGEGVSTVCHDRANHFWYAQWKRGVFQFDPEHKSTIHFFSRAEDVSQRLSNDGVNDIEEDPFHHKVWMTFRDDNKLCCIDEHNRVSEFLITVDGSALDKTISCLTVDSTGNVWVGTLDNGIILFDAATNRCTQIGTAEGLPSQTIYQCVFFGNKIWTYTPKGIAWIDVKTKVISTLHDNNLPAQFMFDEGPLIIDANGTLYFGNGKHIMSFQTNSVGSEKNIDAPIVTAVATEDSSKNFSGKEKQVTIHADENYFTVRFVTPDLLRGKEIQYSYQMNGYDPQWVSTGAIGEARFNHIPPGDYQLQLRAQIAGQPWDGKFSSLNFQILPAYYQTWWFRILMILLGAIFIAAIFYAYFSRRIARLKREQQIQSIRTRIAQDMHDDIGAGLTKIFMQSEMPIANRQSVQDEIIEKLQSISRQSRELVGKLGEVVWSANPKHDDLDSMLAYFRDYIHHFMGGLPLEYEILFPGKILNLPVNPDVRRNLFLILKEALNNCAKHSKATHVRVSFQQKDKEYILKIADDGIGIAAERSTEFTGGNGLNNIKSRAAAMNAKIEFSNNGLQGTTISVKGKLSN